MCLCKLYILFFQRIPRDVTAIRNCDRAIARVPKTSDQRSYKIVTLRRSNHYFPSALSMLPERSSRNASPLRPGFVSTTSYQIDNPSVADDLHPTIQAGRVAVITGAANGIGRAAAIELAKY
jgi:hypothetical protein